MAVLEHIAEFLILRSRGSGYVTISLTEDCTIFKPACRSAEDEICRSLDPAVSEILSLAFAVCIYGILVCNEAAVDECDSVGINCNCACLADRLALTCRVLECDVFSEEVRSIKEYGRSS